MLPRISVPSAAEKIRRHRFREQHCIERDTIEVEISANFSRRVSRKLKQASVADQLLGPEFEDDLPPEPSFSCYSSDGEKKIRGIGKSHGVICTGNASALGTEKSTDWTCRPLPDEIKRPLRGLDTLSVSVNANNGARHDILLSSASVQRLRGAGNSQLSWLDDDTINGFIFLINERSRLYHGQDAAIHRSSGIQDPFNRTRVRTYIFGTHFFEILNRNTNGGYDNVAKWRRKVPGFNTVCVFMFPAFANSNHWVLAVVDVDGRQLIYYDPLCRDDTFNVMDCAVQWMEGEIRTAKGLDPFRGLDVSKWPILCNPWHLPQQSDIESCGIFVFFVAEHFERCVYPNFAQQDMPILRYRAVSILKQKFLPNSENDGRN